MGFLRAQHQLHTAVEAWVREHPGLVEALPDLPARIKSPAIVEDLRVLGCEPPPPGRHPSGSEGHAWGALYVLEGSTLGAPSIERILRRTLSLDSEGPVRFLRWYGNSRSQRWSAFIDALEARGGTLSLDELVQGACCAFTWARQSLVAQGLLPERAG